MFKTVLKNIKHFLNIKNYGFFFINLDIYPCQSMDLKIKPFNLAILGIYEI